MGIRVLVFGSSGMAGHATALGLSATPGISVIDAGPRRVVFPGTRVLDVNNQSSVESLLNESRADFVINCIGVLTKAAETNRLEAIRLNSCFPVLLSMLCARDSRKLIHMSTDCVFSGKAGPYKESDFRDGDLVYDRTKALGEVVHGRDLTVRTSIVGPEINTAGVGLFQWFMSQSGNVTGYARALWSGVTTIQLAKFLSYVITDNPDLSGLLHYSTPGGISKLNLLRLFNDAFGRGIRIDTAEAPVVDKRLVDTRSDFNCKPPRYEEQVVAMKSWIRDRAHLYPQYAPWL